MSNYGANRDASTVHRSQPIRIIISHFDCVVLNPIHTVSGYGSKYTFEYLVEVEKWTQTRFIYDFTRLDVIFA